MEKSLKKSFLLLIILCMVGTLTLAGCSNTDDKQAGTKPISGTEISNNYTDAFSIVDYGDDIKLVTDAENNKFLLVPDGVDTPDIPEAAEATVVHTPLKHVVYCSSTQVSLLKAFFNDESWGSIAGVTTEASQWYIDEVKEGMEKGDITFVGGNSGGMGDPDFELIQSLNPDMVVVYTGEYGQQTTIDKMNELDIPCMVVNDYIESTYMGRMEWIKYLATFYNKDDEAATFMNEKEVLLEQIKSDVKDLDKPKVVWASINDGSVYVPNGGSYVAAEIKDAGGDYVFADLNPDQGSSAQLTLEEFYEKGKDADVFIYSTDSTYMPGIDKLAETAPLLKDFKSIEDNNVYCFTHDYYMSLEKTVEGIKDLAEIFHPDIYSDWELQIYEKLPEK